MTDLPHALDRFGAELETAVARELRSRRMRSRAFRGGVVVAAAVAAALGLLSGLTGRGPSVVQRAAAALDPADGGILHYRLEAEQRNPDGSVVAWRSETWQLRRAPFTRRQIEVEADGIRAESLTQGDTNDLYDARRDVIYVATSQELRAARMPKIEIVSKSKLEKLTGRSRVHAAYLVRKGATAVKVIATEEGAESLRRQFARETARSSGALPDEFRSQILALLRSGRVRDTGHVQVDGRDAVRLESLDGKKIYVVDAATYDPIEWTTSGDGGSVTLRFPVYEQLPVGASSLRLLDLEAQHPGARVVRDARAYIAAEARLYPHG